MTHWYMKRGPPSAHPCFPPNRHFDRRLRHAAQIDAGNIVTHEHLKIIPLLFAAMAVPDEPSALPAWIVPLPSPLHGRVFWELCERPLDYLLVAVAIEHLLDDCDAARLREVLLLHPVSTCHARKEYHREQCDDKTNDRGNDDKILGKADASANHPVGLIPLGHIREKQTNEIDCKEAIGDTNHPDRTICTPPPAELALPIGAALVGHSNKFPRVQRIYPSERYTRDQGAYQSYGQQSPQMYHHAVTRTFDVVAIHVALFR